MRVRRKGDLGDSTYTSSSPTSLRRFNCHPRSLLLQTRTKVAKGRVEGLAGATSTRAACGSFDLNTPWPFNVLFISSPLDYPLDFAFVNLALAPGSGSGSTQRKPPSPPSPPPSPGTPISSSPHSHYLHVDCLVRRAGITALCPASFNIPP